MSETEMSLSDYVGILRRRAVLFAIVLVVTAVGFLMVALREEGGLPEASGQIAINAADPAASLTDLKIAGRTSATEAQVFQRDDVRGIAEAALGPAFDQPRVSARAVDGIDGLQVSAQSKEPQDAVRIVAAFLDAYVAFSREHRSRWFLETEPALLQEIESLQLEIEQLSARMEGGTPQDEPAIGGPGDTSTLSARLVQLEAENREKVNELERLRLASSLTNGGVEIVNQPESRGAPVGTQPLRSLAVGILVGLFLGVGAAFLREYMDKTVRSPKQIVRGIPGLFVLSAIGSMRGNVATQIARERPRCDAADEYRKLRTIIQSLVLSKGERVIQFVGSTPGEGTSETAANIATLLSQVGIHVLLIDTDVQFPTQHRLFGIEPSGDLARVLTGESLETNRSSISPNLDLLSFAGSESAASDLLSGPAMDRLLTESRSKYDVVIIDSSPLSQSSDSYGLSVFADAVILIVGLNVVTMPRVQKSFTALRALDREMLGAVVVDRGVQGGSKGVASVR